jgi:predicted Rossmann fold nucleotide-binding protein DprA/Smf involved in DNA uptake
MSSKELMSEDGTVLAMLCSPLALSGSHEAMHAPLTLKEWNTLARKIRESSLKTPRALLGSNAEELTRFLGITSADAERLVQLLSRGGILAIELEHLAASGIWCVTRADEGYPPRIKNVLKHQAPAVLCGAGELSIFEKPAVAIVGSRDLDDEGVQFARHLGALCARQQVAVVSGGARGTDSIAMMAALEDAGHAIGVLADSLAKTIRQPSVRESIANGRLALVTPYRPDNGFSVGAAMGRNKIIYGAADYSVIVSSDFQKGGTWAGAVEALGAGWGPVFVRSVENVPVGNKELINKGAEPLAESDFIASDDVCALLKQRARSRPQQGELLPV